MARGTRARVDFKKFFRKKADGGYRGWLLPGIALVVVVANLLGGKGLAVEVEPGEVAVVYNQTGSALFGDPVEVVTQQGVIWLMPFFQRVEKIEIRPQIFIMEGDADDAKNPNHVRKLTVRAKDGSNFYFDKVTIAYAVIPGKAPEVIANTGLDAEAIAFAVKIHSREVLRNEFGRYSFEEIADPSTYGSATSAVMIALNERLNPLGIMITNIPPPKPQFDAKVEQAIEMRQNALTEVSVQEERRKKLLLEQERKVQFVERAKSAEYETLVATLEANKQKAENALISSKREADLYVIERDAKGQSRRQQLLAKAKAAETTLRKEAEATIARIKAVGEQGPDVLNREIAIHIFPQLEKISASPFTRPTTPIDIRTKAQ